MCTAEQNTYYPLDVSWMRDERSWKEGAAKMSEHLARAILFRQNYSHGVPEAECRKAANIVGLERSVGFLHDFSSYQTKQSLVYDLQEPFRWIGDVATIEAFESGVLDLKDFFTGDDYRYRIEVEAKRRFLELLKNRFNGGVKYKGKTWKWDTIILSKTQELGRFLLAKSESLDLVEPHVKIQRVDNRDLRDGILKLSSEESKRLEISKSTLHYMREPQEARAPSKSARTLERGSTFLVS